MVDLNRRINRPSGFLPYFFNPAVQFFPIVMGDDATSSGELSKNRWP